MAKNYPATRLSTTIRYVRAPSSACSPLHSPFNAAKFYLTMKTSPRVSFRKSLNFYKAWFLYVRREPQLRRRPSSDRTVWIKSALRTCLQSRCRSTRPQTMIIPVSVIQHSSILNYSKASLREIHYLSAFKTSSLSNTPSSSTQNSLTKTNRISGPTSMKISMTEARKINKMM